MEIKFLGDSGFLIKGSEASVQIDEKKIVIEGVSEPFTISGPGEYEVSGVRVFGIKGGKGTLYLVEIDGLSLVHLDNLDRKLEQAQVEELSSADVLLLPVDGEGGINAETATEVVAQLEPFIVIPFGSIDKFLEQMGEENVRREKKLKLTSKTSLPDDTEVVVLERGK